MEKMCMKILISFLFQLWKGTPAKFDRHLHGEEKENMIPNAKIYDKVKEAYIENFETPDLDIVKEAEKYGAIFQ